MVQLSVTPHCSQSHWHPCSLSLHRFNNYPHWHSQVFQSLSLHLLLLHLPLLHSPLLLSVMLLLVTLSHYPSLYYTAPRYSALLLFCYSTLCIPPYHSTHYYSSSLSLCPLLLHLLLLCSMLLHSLLLCSVTVLSVIPGACTLTLVFTLTVAPRVWHWLPLPGAGICLVLADQRAVKVTHSDQV